MQEGQQCTNMAELLAALFVLLKIVCACECVYVGEGKKEKGMPINCYLERYNKMPYGKAFLFSSHMHEQIHTITQLATCIRQGIL